MTTTAGEANSVTGTTCPALELQSGDKVKSLKIAVAMDTHAISESSASLSGPIMSGINSVAVRVSDDDGARGGGGGGGGRKNRFGRVRESTTLRVRSSDHSSQRASWFRRRRGSHRTRTSGTSLMDQLQTENSLSIS